MKTNCLLAPKQFWSLCHKTRSCWFFQGRAQINYRGRLIYPYRLAWELTHRKQLGRFDVVLHSCENKQCVNPKHLSIGSQKDIEARQPNPARFWKRVDKNGPVHSPKLGHCWLWTGGKYNHGGAGQVQYGKKHYAASRLAWILTYGEIPPGLVVCHKCDNPPCCRPSHLWVGTPKQNSQDMIKKGRWNGRTGIPNSPETRAKISRAMKGKQTRLGAKLSAETKAKIGAKQKAAWARRKAASA